MLRARIVLAAADGLTRGAIARKLEVGVNTVPKWRGGFAALGLASPARRRIGATTRSRRKLCPHDPAPGL
ncbi:helix-turn-helix domain-containing protein (plasmid) [Streptomyces sp. NBC_00853]|nr:helix-turn-helix domain-containing protein [Streptomyces sp. NBC_00853]